MRKRLLLFILCFAMVIGNLSGLTLPTEAASSANEEVSYLDGSDLLYDLMETATTFLVAQHKALGGSHYAYTEGLFEESTGEAASGVGTEMNFTSPSRLVLLTLEKEGDKVKKTEKVVLNSPTGCVRDVDVSADGTKAIFSWKQKPADDFHIYEMELTSGKYEYKQLTFGSGVADFECIYLPNGEILFQSSRAIQTVDCWKTPVSNIYKMSADGKNIVRLGYDQVHTTYPTLTSDGRVIYTRWDYNDRTQMWVQGLFQMNPDGTNQTELYGNNSNFPTTLVHTREVMGETSLYVSIATGHHTYQAGKLCLIDVSTNRDGATSVTFPFPDGTHSKGDNIDAYGQSGAIYQYPLAISKTQFVVSYCQTGWASDKRSTPFGIYLMDSSTKEKICLIEGDNKYPSAQIVPVKTRDMFVRPSMVDYKQTTGTYYVGDVYLGEAMEGVKRGTIKQIRVVALDYRAYAVGATVASQSGSSDPYTPIATGNGSWDVKVVLGVATVYEDGSALFTVPSETPVYFQLLDEDGNMIQTMRSWSTLMPGEIYSCVGCHEDNNTAPPASMGVTMALKAGVETLKPDAWQTDKDYDPYTSKIGFDYLEEVQPILDAKCISCHNNKNASYNKINVSSMNESGVKVTVSGTETKIFGRQETWEYKISASNNPENGWNTTGFTGNWATGKAGFGDRSDSAPVGTSWNGSNNWIFVRKTFTLNDISKYAGASIKLDTFYDDTATYYLNGQEIFADVSDGHEWVDAFTTILVDGKSGLLKEGENVLAVRLNQHTGGRYIDCALSLIVPDNSDTTAANPFSLEGDGIGSQRMSRYFPLSYLVLTGSTPNSGIQWVGNANNSYVKWLSSMSAPEVQKPASYGALVSNLTKLFQNGAKHAGVSLTDVEYRTLAAWIDLCVPAYGTYDANNHWDAAEMREAEEEQNKRDYYVMQNDYARMAIAGTLPKGQLTVSYKTKATGKTISETAQGIVNLFYNAKIRVGDTVTVTLPEGVKYFGFTLSPKQGESIIYCPDGTFTYVVPAVSSLVTTISKTYANSSGYITARILTDAELAAKRNLAENTYDYTNNSSIKSDITGQYPHATASTEWENNKGSGETDFLARNAIDGFKNNHGHGKYPVQSWGPANTGTASQWLNIDFGRAVNAEEIGVVVRYDVGHDTWFKQATVEVTFEDGTKGTQKIDIAWTGYEQIIKLDFDKPITSLKLTKFVADQAGGWAAMTEIAVYGTEVIK